MDDQRLFLVIEETQEAIETVHIDQDFGTVIEDDILETAVTVAVIDLVAFVRKFCRIERWDDRIVFILEVHFEIHRDGKSFCGRLCGHIQFADISFLIQRQIDIVDLKVGAFRPGQIGQLTSKGGGQVLDRTFLQFQMHDPVGTVFFHSDAFGVVDQSGDRLFDILCRLGDLILADVLAGTVIGIDRSAFRPGLRDAFLTEDGDPYLGITGIIALILSSFSVIHHQHLHRQRETGAVFSGVDIDRPFICIGTKLRLFFISFLQQFFRIFALGTAAEQKQKYQKQRDRSFHYKNLRYIIMIPLN